MSEAEYHCPPLFVTYHRRYAQEFPPEDDRRKIASLSGSIFRGQRNRVIMEECGRWLLYITDIFLPIVDSETGDGLEASALPRLRDGSAIYDHADPEAHTAELQEAPFREGGEHQIEDGTRIKRGIVPI